MYVMCFPTVSVELINASPSQCKHISFCLENKCFCWDKAAGYPVDPLWLSAESFISAVTAPPRACLSAPRPTATLGLAAKGVPAESAVSRDCLPHPSLAAP